MVILVSGDADEGEQKNLTKVYFICFDMFLIYYDTFHLFKKVHFSAGFTRLLFFSVL